MLRIDSGGWEIAKSKHSWLICVCALRSILNDKTNREECNSRKQRPSYNGCTHTNEVFAYRLDPALNAGQNSVRLIKSRYKNPPRRCLLQFHSLIPLVPTLPSGHLPMLTTIPSRAIAMILLWIIFQSSATAGDWPQWGGGRQRLMVSDETNLPDSFLPGERKRNELGFDLSDSKDVLWAARLGSKTYGSPTISNGRVYVGTNDDSVDDPRFQPTAGGVLLCLDEATGDPIWRLIVPKLEIDRTKVSEDFEDMNLGICSTATIDGDRVYIVTGRCEVLCLDVHGMANGNDGPFKDEAQFFVGDGKEAPALQPDDADILWQFDMLRSLPVFPHDATNCSVLIYDDLAYVGTGNGVYDGKVVLPTAPTFIALDKLTGELIAKDNGHISANVFHGQWSSPAVAQCDGRDVIVYGGGDGVLYGFQPIQKKENTVGTIEQVWNCDCNPADYRERDGVKLDYWSILRGGSQDAVVDNLIVSPNEIIATPVVSDNRVYVAIGQDPVHGPGAGALSCIDPNGSGDTTGTNILWQYPYIGRSMSTVAVKDGLVFAAETWGKIHCLDAKSGELKWIHDTKEPIWGSPLVADGKLYIGAGKSLFVLAAGPEERLISEVKLHFTIATAPAAANGTLFVATQQNLWAVKKAPASDGR